MKHRYSNRAEHHLQKTVTHVTTVVLLALSFFFSSCGADKKHFRFEGKMQHINQGEFYLYSPDGIIDGLDTLKLVGGRFAIELECDEPGLLLLVFPNFSEHPIFAQPGKTAKLKGDASHLKELQVKGTKDNELMNDFRALTSNCSPPEIEKQAELFVKDHPESPVSRYLVSRYFLQKYPPEGKKALKLVDLIVKNQPKSGPLTRLHQTAKMLSTHTVNTPIPSFKATGLHGETITQAALQKAEIGIVHLWASWNYESMNQLRRLKEWKEKLGSRLYILTVNVDPSKKACMDALEKEDISWPTICEEKMMESNIVQRLGMSFLPDNLYLENGRITARELRNNELRKKLESKWKGDMEE